MFKLKKVFAGLKKKYICSGRSGHGLAPPPPDLPRPPVANCDVM